MSPRSPAEAKCPICHKPLSVLPALAAFAPFCSPRCQDRDLLNWLGDGYALPGEPVDPDDIGLDKREGQD